MEVLICLKCNNDVTMTYNEPQRTWRCPECGNIVTSKEFLDAKYGHRPTFLIFETGDNDKGGKL